MTKTEEAGNCYQELHDSQGPFVLYKSSCFTSLKVALEYL